MNQSTSARVLVKIMGMLLLIGGTDRAVKQLGSLIRSYFFHRLHNLPPYPMSVYAEVFLDGLLGLVAFSAGLAILYNRGWGRATAILQAGLSIVLLLWARIVSLFTMQSPLIQSAINSPIPALSWSAEQTQKWFSTQIVVGWVTFVLLVVWYSFQIWFFSRPSVKAQF